MCYFIVTFGTDYFTQAGLNFGRLANFTKIWPVYEINRTKLYIVVTREEAQPGQLVSQYCSVLILILTRLRESH